MITQGTLQERLRKLISLSWSIFSNKVGNNMLNINKEKSMQLNFAYILQQMIPFIIFQENEKISIELESSISDGTTTREVDILLLGSSDTESFKIAIELKCYKTIASSGGNRGATDIFMKDVYVDLHLLERYIENHQADIGISLVMNDYKNFINPRDKNAKCWIYDISHGTTIGNVHLTTPIGGNPVDVLLHKNYSFIWTQIGGFWFTELEGL